MSFSDYDVLVLKNGGRWDFWVSQVEIIERYIKGAINELIQIRTVAQGPIAPEVKPTGAAKTILWDPTRGGMRMPHLHYAGEIYILNETQWTNFSKIAMKSLTDKLAKVQKVGFEDVMQVTEVMAGM